ncbi:hypothetical protein DFH28DRAFT_1085148 [Melampsora americana]|nr:hypothetical protein DFH28DRAFT_1085148 [Melampsora americana]
MTIFRRYHIRIGSCRVGTRVRATGYRLYNHQLEVDFPRGGGTHLTAVEVKQAGHQGKTDADQIFISDPKPIKEISLKTLSSKRKRPLLDAPSHHRTKPNDHTASQNAPRIEHLNHRRLTSGLKLAGLIIEIRPLELIVALPSQLVGHVPITEISSYYTKQLQDSTNQDEEITDSEDEQSNSDKNDDHHPGSRSDGLQGLNEIFRVGQWIRCMVINTTSGTPNLAHRVSPMVRAAHRVTLTIDPARLNGDLEMKDLSPNMTLDGAVKSIEDNGYVVDLCVPIKPSQQASSSATQTVTTFVLFSDALKIPQAYLHSRELWQIGQIVRCRIDKVSTTGSTCTVFVDPTGIASSVLTTAINIHCILPLHLVTCLITAADPEQGLNVEFLGYYKGTIDLYNLDVFGRDGIKLEDRYKAGQKIRARVLWHTRSSSPRGLAEDDDVDVLGEKVFSLSLLDHCVNMVSPGLPPLLLNDTPNGIPHENIEHLMRFNIGYTFQSARVYRVVDEWGLYVEYRGESIQQRVIGFIHISAICDTHLPSISDKDSGKYKLGTTHKAKVPYIRPQDVAVGEIVTAEVNRLCSTALFMSIFGGLDCVVWPDHYSDVKLQHPEKKFQAGMKLTARVLYVNPNKHRIVLTLRKSLLDPSFSPITSYATAETGMVTNAVITRVKAKHLEIEFFGQTRGVIPIREAAETFSESLSDFRAGRVVKVQILSVDPVGRKILASIRYAADPEPLRLWESCKVGDALFATVKTIGDDHTILTLRRKLGKRNKMGPVIPIPGLISLSILAWRRKVSIDQLKEQLHVGDEIDDLVITAKDIQKSLIILGYKKESKTQKREPETERPLFNSSAFEVGDLVTGTVLDVHAKNLLMFLKKDGSDNACVGQGFLSIEKLANRDKKSCAVVKVDRQTHKVYLTSRASCLCRGVKKSPLEVRDRPIVSIKDLKKGDKIRGFIQRVCEKSGLLVRIGTNLSAKVRISELFDVDIPDWIEKFKVGQVVSGVIITPVKASRGIQLSLRENPFVPKVSDPKKLVLEKLKEGQIVGTIVRKIEKYGMFLAIDDSNISGLCHVSQMFDNDDDDDDDVVVDRDWAKKYKEGMRLKAAVVNVDSKARRISLSIKPSIVGVQEVDSEEDEDEDDFDDDDEEEELDPVNVGDSDSVDMVVTSKSTNQPLAVQIQAPCLALPIGFNWNSTVPTKVADNQDSESEESSEEVTHATSRHVDGQKKHASELGHTSPSDLENGSMLTSIADLERQLLGSPNSSLLWIQLMSYHIQQANLNEARETVNRALNGIHYREEAEKLNVWIAWLNLENAYGTEEQMTKVFGEASKANDTKTVWLKMAEIYTESGKIEKANELYAKLVKKFSESSKAWSLYARFCLTNNRQAQTLELLARSLKSLPKHKHVKTITKFAQYEFKHGEIERGRTLFEGLLASYPKRTDLWNVYIDLERSRLDRVRALFGRMLALKLNPKFGDEASQNNVLEQARAYVQASQSVAKDDIADEQDD